MNVIVLEPNVGYWHETERQIAVSNHYDRRAARALNADWTLVNEVPFGTPRATS